MINENIELLLKEIQQWRHLTIGKIKRLGYFYSDAISILELYKPNTVCDVLNKNYNLGVTFIALGEKYMIFCTENFDTNSNSEVIKLQDMFNNHFGTNGVTRHSNLQQPRQGNLQQAIVIKPQKFCVIKNSVVYLKLLKVYFI